MNRIDTSEPDQRPYRWVMLVLLWLLYVAFGLVARSIAPLVTPILNDLNISYSQMGFILGSWQITYIVVALIGGALIDKWGVRKSIMAGLVVVGLSAALRYFPNGFGGMLLAVVLFGIGGSMISTGGPKAISLWFKGRGRGTAVGIYMTGHLVGGLVVLAVTNSLVMPMTGYSWRLVFVFYGFVTFGLAVLWWFLARDTKAAPSQNKVGIRAVFGRLIKVRNVQILLILGLLSFAIVHGFVNWLPKILETSGFSPAVAGYAASIIFASSLPATLLLPRLLPAHYRGRFVGLLALLSTAGLLVVTSSSGAVLLAGLICFGSTGTCIVPLLILMLMETPEVDSSQMGAAGGIFFCAAEIGGFSGPFIMGALADASGSFQAGIYFMAGLSLLILLLARYLSSGQPPSLSSGPP